MPAYETPDPITATVRVVSGDVRVTAGDRGMTTVTVAPSDASDEDDRKAAALTRVEYADGRLTVRAPKLRSWSPRSHGGSIDVTIALPPGSQLLAVGALADIACDCELGECRIKTGLGDISVEHVTGHADIVAASGEVRLRELDASAVIKNSNGDTWVGRAGGALRARSSNGDIAVDVAEAGLAARSANGGVRLGEALRDTVVLETSRGSVEVGIREGTTAWLDVRATAGRVHNALDAAEAP